MSEVYVPNDRDLDVPPPPEDDTFEAVFPGKPTSPLQIINDYLTAELAKERKTGRSRWWASGAGYCMRRECYERAGISRVREEDPRSLRVMNAGKIFHRWAQGLIDAAVGEAHAERELTIPELDVVGHVDNIVQLAWGWTLVDYKSQHGDSFWHGKKNGTMLKDHQRLQLGTYLLGLQKDYPGINGMVLYISRDDLSINQEVVMWTSQLENDVRLYWDTLNNYWAKRDTPPRFGTWECKWCPYSLHKKTDCETVVLP